MTGAVSARNVGGGKPAYAINTYTSFTYLHLDADILTLYVKSFAIF